MTIVVSDAFKREVKRSHEMILDFQVYTFGTATSLGFDLHLIDGQVNEDKANSIRRRASLTFLDPTGELAPETLESIFAPNTNEIKPMRGIRLSDGTEEYVSMGVYGFTDVVVNDDGQKITVQIEGFDRSSQVARQRFTDVYSVASGTDVSDAIIDIVTLRIPNLVTRSEGSVYVTPALTFDRGSDPWEAVTKIAESAGKEVFFDEDGALVIQDTPVPSIENVKWTFDTESNEAVFLTVERKLSFPEYNHVIEIGEGPGILAPFRAEAQDDNPQSPTWVGYGDYPFFHVSEFYTDVAQCEAAAIAKLRNILGATESVRFDCVPNPALAVGDIISINHPRTKIESTVYIVDSVSTPLIATRGQSCSVRERVIS